MPRRVNSLYITNAEGPSTTLRSLRERTTPSAVRMSIELRDIMNTNLLRGNVMKIRAVAGAGKSTALLE